MGNYVKLEVFVPATHLEQIRQALRDAGAGAIGNYDSAMSYSPVRGCWRPLPGSSPYDGQVGELCEADEYKVEVICPSAILDKAVAAVKKAHPYELPVINAIPLLDIALE